MMVAAEGLGSDVRPPLVQEAFDRALLGEDLEEERGKPLGRD